MYHVTPVSVPHTLLRGISNAQYNVSDGCEMPRPSSPCNRVHSSPTLNFPQPVLTQHQMPRRMASSAGAAPNNNYQNRTFDDTNNIVIPPAPAFRTLTPDVRHTLQVASPHCTWPSVPIHRNCILRQQGGPSNTNRGQMRPATRNVVQQGALALWPAAITGL